MAYIINKKSNIIVRLLNGINFLLKEMMDFYRFFLRTPDAEKKIVFYSEHESYYSYFEGIIKELISKHKQTLCYVTSDPCDPILQKSESRIKPFYLNKLFPIFMSIVNCRVFVITMTDLDQFHIKRSINPVHYIYVFHSLVSTHLIYRYGAFDHYDSILCCGLHQVKEISQHEKFNKLPQKKLIKAGYYRLERIYQAYQRCYQKNLSSSAEKTILIAPSWGVDNILESCGENLISILLKEGYNVIVRPHPETIIRFPNLVAKISSKFRGNPNFTLETSVSADESLIRADVLISDYSGISFEYAFGTERPVLFLDVPLKIHNPRFKELGIEPLELSLRSKIGVIVSPKKLEIVPQVISNLIANNADYKKRIIGLRKKYVYAFGHSSKISAKYITSFTVDKNHGKDG